ncbi:MAG: hypothetical protein D4R77_06275 [Planctomycetaceae bacterium]|nr:MAG: hypothetical protein D4R77_06275 [Planctomycetaceae bacterium]
MSFGTFLLPRSNLFLHSPIHEERLVSLLILVVAAAESGKRETTKIFDFYMNNVRFMNSWGLSDVSAPSIVGAYLIHKSRKPLVQLAQSGTLWERRITVVATLSNQRTGRLSTIRRKRWFVKNVLHNPPSMTPYTSPHRFCISCELPAA